MNCNICYNYTLYAWFTVCYSSKKREAIKASLTQTRFSASYPNGLLPSIAHLCAIYYKNGSAQTILLLFFVPPSGDTSCTCTLLKKVVVTEIDALPSSMLFSIASDNGTFMSIGSLKSVGHSDSFGRVNASTRQPPEPIRLMPCAEKLTSNSPAAVCSAEISVISGVTKNLHLAWFLQRLLHFRR